MFIASAVVIILAAVVYALYRDGFFTKSTLPNTVTELKAAEAAAKQAVVAQVAAQQAAAPTGPTGTAS